MTNQIKAIAHSISNNDSTTKISAERTPDGLKIYGVSPGDKIRIVENQNSKNLYVNGQNILFLPKAINERRILIYGNGLSSQNIEVKGEANIPTTIRLHNPKSQIIEEFMVENRVVHEKNILDKIGDSGIRGSISPTHIKIQKDFRF